MAFASDEQRLHGNGLLPGDAMQFRFIPHATRDLEGGWIRERRIFHIQVNIYFGRNKRTKGGNLVRAYSSNLRRLKGCASSINFQLSELVKTHLPAVYIEVIEIGCRRGGKTKIK